MTSIPDDFRTAPAGDDPTEQPSLPLEETLQRDLSDQPFVGRYRIDQTISVHKQSTVFKAYDPDLQRHVSLKLYHGHAKSNGNAVERVVAEGRALAKVESSYVARCYNVEKIDDVPILVNEWIDGQTLQQYLADHALTFGQVKTMFRKIAQGIAAIHAQGLLHRDIKPANIIVDESGNPKVIDLGLAQSESDDATPLAGTMAYVAPEVIRGETDRIGVPTDIFGLGGVLYFLLTGQPVFEGESWTKILEKAQTSEIRPSHEAAGSSPNQLDRICAKCLQLEPADRYQSVDELLDQLRPGSWMPLAVVSALLLIVVAWIVISRNDNPASPQADRAGVNPVPNAEGQQPNGASAEPIPLIQQAESAAMAGDFLGAIRLAEECQNELDEDDAANGSMIRKARDLVTNCYLQIPDIDAALKSIQQKLDLHSTAAGNPGWIGTAKVELQEIEKLKALDDTIMQKYAIAKRLYFKGRTHLRAGPNQFEIARTKTISALTEFEESIGTEHLDYLECLDLLATCNFASDRMDEIPPLLVKMEGGTRAVYGPYSARMFEYYRNRAEQRLGFLGQPHSAMEDLEKAAEIARKVYGPDSESVFDTEAERLKCLVYLQRFQPAADQLKDVIERLRSFDPDSLVVARAMTQRAEALIRIDDLDECESELRQARTITEKKLATTGKAQLMMARIDLTWAELACLRGDQKLTAELSAQVLDVMAPNRIGKESYAMVAARLAVLLARVDDLQRSDELVQELNNSIDPATINRKSALFVSLAEAEFRHGRFDFGSNNLELVVEHLDVNSFITVNRVLDALQSIAGIDHSCKQKALEVLGQVQERIREEDQNESGPATRELIELSEAASKKITG